MVISGWVIFLVICLVVSILLIRSYQYDLRFDRTIDPGYYARFPGVSKTVSVIKLIPRYMVLATLLAWLVSFLYNFLATRVGWTAYPNLTLSDFAGLTFVKLDTFWYVAAVSAWVIAMADIMRCAVTPLKHDLSKQAAPVQPQPVEDDAPIDDQEHWDIFVSYKSEDVDLARRIADQLIASGLQVWFAEYQVLLQNYAHFQRAIDFGIAHSEWGICLTNNRYIGSKYCHLEMKELLEHLPPKNVLEIMVPREDLPHREFRALDDSPAYVGSDLPGIFTFITQHTGWVLQPSLPEVINTGLRTHTSKCMKRDVSLDITDWRVERPGRLLFGSTDILVLEYLHRRDQYRFLVNLVCGPELARQGNRIGQTIDDRQMGDLLRTHSVKHIERLKAKVYGLHLIFHQGLSQFAITYRMHGYWTRKYSVVFPNPLTFQNAEFVFTFGFMGSFKQYCQNVHLMDRLVKSLEWN